MCSSSVLTYLVICALFGEAYSEGPDLNKSTIDDLNDLLNAPDLFPESDMETKNQYDGMSRPEQLMQLQNLLNDNLPDAYANYKKTYNKSCAHRDDTRRMNIFNNTLHRILKHNWKARIGRSAYEMGVNKFSDLTNAEVVSKYAGYNYRRQKPILSYLPRNPEMMTAMNEIRGQPPGSLDWREKGAVSPVKDQSDCGACVPFATVACLESAFAIKYPNKPIVDLSEQEILDCSRGNGNMGCQGNALTTTFDYLKDTGLTLEKEYPYKNKNGMCKRGTSRVAKVASWWTIYPEDEMTLARTVATYGPTVVGMTVNDAFENYRRGIFDGCTGEINHAVVVVGYGSTSNQNGTEYWILKNSWGTDWGERGYMRMRRNSPKCKRIATDAMVATAA